MDQKTIELATEKAINPAASSGWTEDLEEQQGPVVAKADGK